MKIDLITISLLIFYQECLILKGNIKKQKKRIGQILADGLYYMIKRYPFLLQDESYLIIPPKNDSSEENQCLYFLNPLIKTLNKEGYNIKDLSSSINRISNIGKNRGKPMDIRFKDIKDVHKLDDVDLDGKNVLILDDVVTSKSTIWDISRELKEKNAGEINVLSIGRALLSEKSIMEDDVYDDLKFNELITYFSNLESILEPKKINSLNVEKCKFENNKFECKIKDYDIHIDFENLILKHNCKDFYRRKYLNKSFCKHITKFFIDIKNKKGEEFAQQKLYSIYKFLIHWNFDYNP